MQAIFRCAARAAFLIACSSHAHVTLEYQVAPAASSYKATFRVGHGCGTSPTRQVAVAIPPGVQGAKPMPKPGWQIDMQRDGDQVRRIMWTARTAADALPDGQYDEYVLMARMPAAAGTIHWPVEQVCIQGRHDWTEVPAAGQDRKALKSPAPALEILPAAGAGGHAH